MINYNNLSIKELQNYGISGDQQALLELGKRVLDMPIFNEDSDHLCDYRDELESLQTKLEQEIPPGCPNCNHWLTDV